MVLWHQSHRKTFSFIYFPSSSARSDDLLFPSPGQLGSLPPPPQFLEDPLPAHSRYPWQLVISIFNAVLTVCIRCKNCAHIPSFVAGVVFWALCSEHLHRFLELLPMLAKKFIFCDAAFWTFLGALYLG